MRRTTVIGSAFAIFAAALSACAPAPTREEAYSSLHGDSGITGRPFAEIVNDLRATAQRHAQLAEVVEYGQTSGGRALTVIKIQDKSVEPQGKRPAVLISEGIHGNEFLNISDRLPGELLDRSTPTSGVRKFLAKGGVLYIVPVLNPDGYSSRQRENARGQDLNRDFTIKAAGNRGFTQAETKGISDYMGKEAGAMNFSLEMSMEYHCCIGGLIHPWAYTQNPLPQDALTRHRDVGEKVKGIFGYRYGTVREIVGYDAVGGSDDYYFETYGRRAFSFEGAEGRESQNLAKHVDFWNQMFDMIAATTPDGSTNPTNPTNPQPPTGSLFLALAGESGTGLTLLASAPEVYESVTLCVGDATQCASGGTGQVLAGTLAKTQDGMKIFRISGAVNVTGAEQVVQLRATKAGGAEATQRALKLVKK